MVPDKLDNAKKEKDLLYYQKSYIEALLKGFLTVHQQELNELIKAQSETLDTVLKRIDQNTHEVASHQTDRLINAIQKETGKQKKYADVIESGTQKPVLVPDETEGF